jgi:CRP-like cAMP-binding protein
MEDPEAYLGRLKPIYIFKGLTDDQILEVARELELERHPSGEVIFHEKDEGDSFYIINHGQVKVLRERSGGAPKLVSTLMPGDFFGETALLYGRRRSATVETEGETELLRLGKAAFDRLIHKFPQIKPNLLLSTESRELYRHVKFSWLQPNEVVYLIARKHRILLYQSLFPPFLLGGLVAVAAIWLAVSRDALWIAYVGVALEVPVALWMAWNWVDWGNDFYIITSQRLVDLEKIVGIYDSRVEAPLSSIMSVNVQTADSGQRAVHMGDVVVRTFSGPIVLKSVENPLVLAAAVEEHWYRSKSREREDQLAGMRRVVRERLERGTHPPPPRPRPPAAKPEPKPISLGQRIAGFFTFRLRFEEGDTVIYRKHWFILLHDIWKSSLGMLLLVVMLVAYLAGFSPVELPPLGVALVVGALFLPLAGWWLYEYEDWKNDIYMVTIDQIFDVNKKPFGPETRKSAPLVNVLSLKYERPGVLGMLLNFGTVVATVAGTEFRFEGVFDPVGVQNDIYRRQEMQKAKKEAADTARKNEEMADWLLAYEQVDKELRAETAKHARPSAAKGPAARP